MIIKKLGHGNCFIMLEFFFTYRATARGHIMAPILTDTVDLAGF